MAIAGRKNSDRIASNLIAVAASQVRVLGADWSYHYKLLLEDADQEQGG